MILHILAFSTWGATIVAFTRDFNHRGGVLEVIAATVVGVVVIVVGILVWRTRIKGLLALALLLIIAYVIGSAILQAIF